MLDTLSNIVNPPAPLAPPTSRHDIEFVDVTFGYGPEESVLQEVSFHIEDGETVALVGITGVGKSTACHLILRMFDVTAGAVRISGVDVRQLSLQWLREHVGLVSQDVFLFSGTIRENVLLGKPGAEEEDLYQACRAAHADEFIRSFPSGYDTLVGERGVRLSGGQKQCLAIARALLKDAPILVLDEATSAVDTTTEFQIKEALAQATQGRTVLLVAHRRTTIQTADRILVLEQGRITESGTYQELVSNGGPFSQFFRMNQDTLA